MQPLRSTRATTLIATALLCGALSLQASGSATPVSGYVTVEGGKLFYEEAGSGEPIVLLHDGLLHRETWNLQFADLATTHRVVRYDRRGYGNSTPPEAPYSPVEDLLQVLDTLTIDAPLLIGLSAGSRLAVDFTLAHPDRVSALILVGPVVSGMPFTNHFYDRGGRVTPEMFTDRDTMMDFYVQHDPYNIAPASTAARAMAQKLLDANRHNFNPVNNQRARLPQRTAFGRLAEIHVPTLIVAGEHDIADVHAHCGALEAGIAGAQRELIRNAGHLVPLEQPERFLGAVRRFLHGGNFTFILRTEGVEKAAALFRQGRRTDPNWIPFDEMALNQVAYTYLFQGDTQGAIKLFELNVEAYPDSFNTYDSLGEALLKVGDRAGAEANYRRSLALNPENRNAVQVLESMGVSLGESEAEH